MSEIINNACIFYQNVAPEFVVMERHMDSGIAYYRNNGHIELRDKIDNHIIREEEMTKKTIDYLKQEFEEDKRMSQQTELECARIREYKRRTICDK